MSVHEIIQVDMFAVGLGAAVLTQFRLEDGARVTILSDGGMETGKPPDTVLSKLPQALDDFFPNGPRRIDLIVGTHYDGDHLKGLLPILEDTSIEIGDVWLPPVRKESEEILETVEASGFLARQLFDDEDWSLLLVYLAEKVQEVEWLRDLEFRATALLRKPADESLRRQRPLPNYPQKGSGTMDTVELSRNLQDTEKRVLPRGLLTRSSSKIEREGEKRSPSISPAEPGRAVDIYQRFFESHEADAIANTGIGSIHDCGTYDSRYPDVLELALEIHDYRKHARYWRWRLPVHETLEKLFAAYPDRARIVPMTLATIRKSVARGAITAIHLAKLVEALRGRKIRPRCQFVTANRPRKFAWSPSKKRFINWDRDGDAPLLLTLLGPSEQFIQRHSMRLPVSSLADSLFRVAMIHLESITPSNQLSYIFTLEMKGQRILVSGDSGCYGFRRIGDTYHSELLRPLAPLHVVQIAHHGGHNYDFYNALLAAGFADQTDRAFLLLSHAKHDRYRPSTAFQEFIARIGRDADELSLLFTSVPDYLKVEEYHDLIHPVVPAGLGSEEGDLRLTYRFNDGSGWTVDRHAVAV
jgi:beta-lactamase superfamily II metal-dependent hydrolase